MLPDWRMVPREPTLQMYEALNLIADDLCEDQTLEEFAERVWKAMYDAFKAYS